MSSVSAALESFDRAQMILEMTSMAHAQGHVSAETVSAQKLAEVQADAQVQVLKEALEAETRILDLLV